MTLVLPTAQSAPTYDAQAVTDEVDLFALGAQARGLGVLSGCAVSWVSGMNVAVAAGVVVVPGQSPPAIAVGAVASLPVPAASTTDRRDLVVFTVGTGVQVIQGVPCAIANWTATPGAPLAPVKLYPLPANTVPLGEVYVPGGAVALSAAAIIDKTPTQLSSYSVPTVVATLAAQATGYHQAPQVMLQGTFVAPAATFALDVSVSGYVQGAEYSGSGLFLVVGIPVGGGNAAGGILGEEVHQVGGSASGNIATAGTVLIPSVGAANSGLCPLGAILGEMASGGFRRKVVYSGATAGTTYTAQIIAGSISGLDLAPAPVAADTLGNVALTPGYDPLAGGASTGVKDLWVADFSAASVQRYQIGRRVLAAYEGVQPRLLYKNSLPTGANPYRMAMDKNGKLATANAGATTVTLIDTTANGHAGAVIATPSFAAAVDDISAAPDGSGFWCAVHNTSLVKINPTTGAVITTWALAAFNNMRVVVSNDGTVAYLWSDAYPGIISINLATGVQTTGPAIASVSCLALSPDGTYLLVGQAGATQCVRKLPLPTLPALPGSAANQFVAATRLGVTLNMSVRQIAISPNSRMWFVAGDLECWCYGWGSDMAIYDGVTGQVTNGFNNSGIVVTEVDGIYMARCSGTLAGLPAAQIYAFPGSKLFIDPANNNNSGSYGADILLS